jgi:hypothetical protein
MKKEICFLVLIFWCVSNISFSQEKNKTAPYHPTNYLIYVTASDFDISGVKPLDSLLKLKNDSAIIVWSNVGDITKVESYRRFYKIGNYWKYDCGNGKSRDLFDNPQWRIEALSFILRKHITFQDAAGHSTLQENYCYLLVVKDKVVESIMSNAQIGEIAEVDPALKDDVAFFKKFDEYALDK